MGDQTALLDQSGRDTTVRVLLITRDPATVSLMRRARPFDGWEIEHAADSRTGLDRASVREFDVVIVDRELAPESGLDVVRRLRQAQAAAPVIMLTSTESVGDRVAGLHLGADDCLDRTVEPAELAARVRALRRRGRLQAGTVPLGAARVDLARRTAIFDDGRRVRLTGQESTLIAVLAASPGRVVSRARLNALVFPETSAKSLVDTYVYYLRRKLGREAVMTAHGVGYRLGHIPHVSEL